MNSTAPRSDVELGIDTCKYGTPVRTGGDLLRMFEELNSHYEIEDR
jgi:hypothetical protein